MSIYKPVLFQKEILNATVYDIAVEWGIFCISFPFKLFGNAKELPSKSWIDQNGDDEFVPTTLRIEAYDIEVEFAYKGDKDTANQNILSFLKYISGISDTGASLKIYDSFTKIGRKSVRYKSIKEDVFVRTTSEGDVVTFSVTFKVNDPTTDIVPESANGVIINLL